MFYGVNPKWDSTVEMFLLCSSNDSYLVESKDIGSYQREPFQTMVWSTLGPGVRSSKQRNQTLVNKERIIVLALYKSE